MLLSYLGFILVAWLITGFITGIAEILVAPREYILNFCKEQEGYADVRVYFTDDVIYKFMRVVIVLICTALGFIALPHHYKIVKDVRLYKEKQSS